MYILWHLDTTRPFLPGAAAVVSCLALVFPGTVCAHTVLLRSDPASDVVLHPAPVQVHLWFSAAVDPAFSTAIVENSAHEYVNDRDAQLSPADTSEMNLHLRPHLPQGSTLSSGVPFPIEMEMASSSLGPFSSPSPALTGRFLASPPRTATFSLGYFLVGSMPSPSFPSS